MNDQLLSLTKIFTDKLYRIPDYQRGYSWNKKEIKDFWNDLSRLEENKNHYIGVLTLEPVYEQIYKEWIDDVWLIGSKGYRPYYVVDGQQRLTTSLLLINVIISTMRKREIPKLNYTKAEEIQKRFIYESKDENLSKTYLFSYETDNPNYEYLIENIYENKKEKNIDKTLYTINLKAASDFFKNKLEKLTNEEVEKIYTKITQRFLFNTYEISSDIDVYVTFETMNNRGKALSHLELLKNRLIYLSTLFDIPQCDKQRLRRDINECWKQVYYYLGKNIESRLDDDVFLSCHFQLYFCNEIKKIRDNEKDNMFYIRVSYGSYYQEYLLEKYFLPQCVLSKDLLSNDIFNYIDSLKSSIMYWHYINMPKDSNYSMDVKEYLKKINYLLEDMNTFRGPFFYSMMSTMSVYVILLSCLEKQAGEKCIRKFLKALERYLFIMILIPVECYVGLESETFISFQEIITKLEKKINTLDEIADRLDKIVNNITVMSNIIDHLKKFYGKNGFYKTPFLKYFLAEYELSLSKESKNTNERLNRDEFFRSKYNIEHIYPKISRNSYWLDMFKDYTQNQKKALKNSLGNFVVISEAKNSKLGNKFFPDKKGNAQNTVGYKYGTYSEIQLCEYTDWGLNEIADRGMKLLEFLNKHWEIKLFNKKQDKLDFLGLKFLIKNQRMQ